MVIDFHCHISTPGSKMPDPDGPYYRKLPAIPPAEIIAPLTQEAIDAVAETLRGPIALKTYRNLNPLIFSEMSRRLISADSAALLAEMASNGVQQSVVVGLDPFVPTAGILKVCSSLSGVLIPFGSLDSKSPGYLDRFAALLETPIRGIKYHSDLQELPIDSPKMQEMMKLLRESGRTLPVYLHTGNFPIYPPMQTPWNKALPGLLEEFGDIVFVCGHSGWENPRAALRCALRHSNLYLETSWQPPAAIRRLCDKVGPERLLFGSDFPLYSQRRALRNLRKALNDAEFEFVSHKNAQMLLGM